MVKPQKYAEVLLPFALQGTFTYLIPDAILHHLEKGMRVMVPFGQRSRYIGVIWNILDDQPKDEESGTTPYQLKEIISIIDQQPTLDKTQMTFWNWMAEYYLCYHGEVMKAALPAPLRDRSYLDVEPRITWMISLAPEYQNETKLNEALDLLKKAPRQYDLLTGFIDLSGWSAENPESIIEQADLIKHLKASHQVLGALIKKGILLRLEKAKSAIHKLPEELPRPLTGEQLKGLQLFKSQIEKYPVQLLHGITSSGKTEIYIHLITEQIGQGHQVLYLLPEIALTTQLINRLRTFFGSKLLVYHSRFTDHERLDVWNKVAAGDDKGYLILGVRSSVFLPFKKLGMIIVDEEHENTYKQFDPAPRYHARDCSIILGQLHKVPVLLGTATPSVETYHHAYSGKYGLIHLNERFGGTGLPRIILADTREAKRKKIMHGHFTPIMLEGIDQALVNNEQVILFQNRRGYSPYIECMLCGYIPKCLSCDVNLTYHRHKNRLVCHYCGHTAGVPSLCPQCGSTGLIAKGLGTQKIEDDIGLLFPGARVQRMDVDSTRSRHSYEKILQQFENGEIDILIGTQMISKGLDFNKVSLVGIMDADQLLNYPDFRSYERSFQLMVQVSGRAGRRDQQGTVIIQCSDVEHPVILQVLGNRMQAFYQQELSERKVYHYPPFARLLQIHLKHRDQTIVQDAALQLASEIRRIVPGKGVIGPQAPLIGRIQNLHLRMILIKLQKNSQLRETKARIQVLAESFKKKKIFAQLIIQMDVDPV